MRHFRRNYLKTNRVSKTEGTRKVEQAYHFMCAGCEGHGKENNNSIARRQRTMGGSND